MASQRDAEGDLISVYRRLLAVIVLMVLLAVVAYRYFGSLDSLSSHRMAVEQGRLVNIVGMVHSQWLREGKGKQLKLDWEAMHQQTPASPVVVGMTPKGWPQPTTETPQGCRELWRQLMGYEWDLARPVSFDEQQQGCAFLGNEGDTIIYQPGSGKVSLVTQTN